MLYTIAVVLLILWLLGLVSSYFIGGFIHVLPVIAIVVVLLRMISGRKPICWNVIFKPIIGDHDAKTHPKLAAALVHAPKNIHATDLAGRDDGRGPRHRG